MARKHAKLPPPGSPAPAAPAADPPIAASPVDVLIRQGLQAIEEYDFELARTALTHAFELSGGAEAAARALLGLLIDHLAADREALDLGEHLSREVLASPDVRLPLALAAARCGERQRARALLGRAEGTPAAEVLVALAGATLMAGELDEATRLCDEARSHDSAHLGAQEMARQIARSREDARRPLEAELTRVLATGAIDEARRLAEHLLARFPDSAVARRTVRAAVEQQRASEAERLVNAAEQALTQADPEVLSASCHVARIALAAAPPNEKLAGRLAALEEEAAARDIDAKVSEVARHFADRDQRAGLTRYASLSPETRRRVRERTGLPMLDDVEHILGKRSDAEEAVSAVLALGEATANADDEPEEALRKLSAHERALAGLPAASRLAALLRQRLREERQRELAGLLAKAHGALAGGDAAGALEVLGKVGLRELDPADREAAEALRTSARTLLETKEMEASYERLLQTADPLAARAVAEQLLARASEAERPGRQDQIAAATAAVRRAFGVWVYEVGDDAQAQHETPRTIELGVPLTISTGHEDVLPWIDADASSLILLECCDRWLFLHTIDLAAGRVRAHVVIRTPEPLDYCVTAISPAGTLVVAGDQGAVLELSLATWDPLSWRSSREIASGDIVDLMQIADARLVWIHSRHGTGPARTRVVDLKQRRVVREMSDGWWFRPLLGAPEPTIAYSRRDTTLTLHHPGGALVNGGRIELPASVRGAIVHPSDGRILVFVGEEDENGERVGFMEIQAAGRASAPVWLDDMNGERPWAAATSRAHRTSFMVAYDDNDQISLHALGTRQLDRPVERLYQTQLPTFAFLAHDPASQHVFALIPDHERLHAVPLGAECPIFPDCAPDPERVQVPDIGYLCKRSTKLDETHYESVRELKDQPERSAMTWMQRRLTANDADIVNLLVAYDMLCSAGQSTVADELLRRLKENWPSDPHLMLLEAQALAEAEHWAEVRDRLEGIDLRAIIPERRQHAYHLLAFASLREGAPERATAVIEEGLGASQGDCRLAELLVVVEPIHSNPDDAKTRSSTLELRVAIRDADICLLHGDPSGARTAIDRRIVWQGQEVQSLARLADTQLLAEPDADIGKLRKALALARFLDAQRKSHGLRKELPLPGTSWPTDRLLDVERRAQAWLERLGLPDEPPQVLAPPAWSLALQELDAALDAMALEQSPRAPARLAFRIRNTARKLDAIEPLFQRSLRNGRFSAGQLVDVAELLAAPELFADDADAAAIAVLTEGGAPSPRSRPSLSRARLRRLLDTLVGHPRVFLAERPAEPVKVQRARLGVELVADAGGLVLRFLIGGARWTAAELLAHAESSVVIDVDVDRLVVTLTPLGSMAQALAQALERHQPVFPPESHDELLQRLGAIQHTIDLHLPDMLSGEVRDADSRPVVRLTPVDDTELLVEIGVRPVPGAVFGPPGEGSVLVVGASGGLCLSARRDHAAEHLAAERVMVRLPLDGTTKEARWRHRLTGEERILAVVEALAELGAEVIVEWPKDARAWRWLGKVTRKELRVRITHTRDLLRIEGGIEIDGHRVALALLLEAIRQGRRYVIIGPHMFVALAADLRERLEAARDLIFDGRGGLEAGLAAAPVLAELMDEQPSSDAAWHALRERTSLAHNLDSALPAGLRADLRPYQRDGFRWLTRLATWGAGACLADDMGLGKTLQTLALLVHRAALGPALVLAPISVTPGWLSECARFAPELRARPYRGSNREALLTDARPGDLFIAGYGVVTRDDALASVHFATLVLDEAQVIKNAVTRRARAVQRLQADFRVALTGTPIENHLGELWSLFRVISPGLLGTWPQFRERFAAPIERDQSAERRAALARVLRPFLLRRTKEAVLPELPPRIELDRLVTLSSAERELYETARLAAAVAIAEATEPSERFAVLGWLTRLRRLSCHPRLFDETWTGPSSKLAAFLAIVDELREAGHRALVFSQFTDHLAVVREALTARGISLAYLDGSTPVDQRARTVEAFQRGGADLFLISLKAGGTGLNLTAADHVIHLDPWWNPAVEDQATDRAHRIGQTRPVTVIRLIAQGTIEEAVLALHAEKRDLAERLLAGTDTVGRMSADALIELVRRGALRADAADTIDEDEADTDGEPADTGDR